MKTYQGYSFYRYNQVEEKWLSTASRDGGKELPVDTLCWVLQSKGKKRGRKGQLKPNNDDEDDDDDYDDSTDKTGQQQQRKQLFNRAWIMKPKEDEIAATNSTNITTNSNRILVRYPKGSTYHVKRENLLPVLQQERIVVVIPETRLYRRWCVVHTQPKDSFCEIGCDVGILVNRIRQLSLNPQHVSGMDKSTTSIADAKKRYPECTFLEWSVPLQDEQQEQSNSNNSINELSTEKNEEDNGANGGGDNNKSQIKGEETTTKEGRDKQTDTSSRPPLPMDLFPMSTNYPTNKKEGVNTDTTAGDMKVGSTDEINKSLVVAIDINGNRMLKAVEQCIQIVIGEWKPRLIIVKSRSLFHELKNNM